MSNTAQSLASTRINSLLDENSFVEIGGFVTARNTDFNMQQTETPSDGVITGYGVIDGNLVYVYSQDASVLGGTIGEMHAKKIAGLYDMAMKMGAPVIGLVDCAGLRLQEATDALNAFGEIYLKQSLASGVIPQITAVFGNCGGGLALVPGLTDFTFMESKNAKLFVNSPNALDGKYGVIDGNLVYVYSQDASVLGGTIGEMHAKKIAGLYDMAMKMGAPVIGLVDCAGLRLQEATDALNAFGEIYLKQSLASGVIPQITAVFGNCGGGLALVPGLTDFTFMESKNAKLFVNSPNALDGNRTEVCDTAAAAFQSEEAGLVDFVGSEEEIFAGIRQLVTMLPANNEDDDSYEECTDDLNRVCADLANAAGDTAILLSQISDNGVFVETKAAYAKEMVTGFIKLNGMTVGAVANRTEVYDEEGNKGRKQERRV